MLSIDNKEPVFLLFLFSLYYTVCYITGIFYAVARQMLFTDNKDSVFFFFSFFYYSVLYYWHLLRSRKANFYVIHRQ